jgi:hypothetical protein
MIHIIYISVILLLLYLVINLFIKNKKQELILLQYLDYLDKFSKIIELSDVKIKDLDNNEMFSSDDEVGFFFKTIKEIQNVLNSFTLKVISQTTQPTQTPQE